MDYSPPRSSVHRILQARIVEWVVISFSRGSSRPRIQIQVSRITGRSCNWATLPNIICKDFLNHQTSKVTFYNVHFLNIMIVINFKNSVKLYLRSQSLFFNSLYVCQVTTSIFSSRKLLSPKLQCFQNLKYYSKNTYLLLIKNKL